MEHGINYVNAFFASIRQNTGTDVRTRKPTDETGVKGQTRAIPDGNRCKIERGPNQFTDPRRRERKIRGTPISGGDDNTHFWSTLSSREQEEGDWEREWHGAR